MEIERKYALKALPEGLGEGDEIIQGYLCTNPTIRLRKIWSSHILTIKSGSGIVRQEYELNIPQLVYDLLWPLTGSRIIEKTRFTIDYDGHWFEFDQYSERYKGLVILEVEFNTEENAKSFELPDWVGEHVEVTRYPRFSNAGLSVSDEPLTYDEIRDSLE